MKAISILLFTCFFYVGSIAQVAPTSLASSALSKISLTSIKKLQSYQDTLKEFAYYLNTDSLTEDRMVSDSQFTRTLVRALQVPYSFHFPFDSVKGISKLYAPDSSFRIITWNLQYNDYYNRQRGATYYNIIKKDFQGKSYYTLFGIDANNAMSTIKWMEVLHFTQQGEPLFGGPFFSYQKDSVVLPTQYRIQVEYKKDASILMNYIPDMDLILVDHLISENGDVEHKWTYVPSAFFPLSAFPTTFFYD